MVGCVREPEELRVIAWPAFQSRTDNPYTYLLYTRIACLGVQVEDCSPLKLIFGRHHIWHVHWPESILNLPQPWKAVPLTLALQVFVKLSRLKGTKIVWTVHNLQSHDGLYPELESRLWHHFVTRLDGYIALTEGGRADALARHPSLRDRPGFVIPHGPYRAVYPDSVTRLEARSRLGLPRDARVLVWLGQVRPYKNLTHLIETFHHVPDSDTYLVVAGKPSTSELAQQVRQAAGRDARVLLHLDFIPDDEVQVYLRAADLVVLPYREVLNSGSAILALSFACPVLVCEQGAMAELQHSMGREWVHTYHGELRPETLREALDWALRTPRDLTRPFRELSWDTIARQTLAAYQEISAG